GNELLIGYAGDERLYGGIGNDTLMGDEGNETITDTHGNNSINGGAGNDTINVHSNYMDTFGNVDVNTVTGGTGIDTFQVYDGRSKLEITDFATGAGGDILDVSSLLTNASGYVTGTNPFDSGYLRLVQMGANVQLQFDNDSVGSSYNWKSVATLLNVNLATNPLGNSNFTPTATPSKWQNVHDFDQFNLGELNGLNLNGHTGQGSFTTGVWTSTILAVIPSIGTDIFAGNSNNGYIKPASDILSSLATLPAILTSGETYSVSANLFPSDSLLGYLGVGFFGASSGISLDASGVTTLELLFNKTGNWILKGDVNGSAFVSTLIQTGSTNPTNWFSSQPPKVELTWNTATNKASASIGGVVLFTDMTLASNINATQVTQVGFARDGALSTNARVDNFEFSSLKISPVANPIIVDGAEDSAISVNLSSFGSGVTTANFKIPVLPADGILYSDVGLTNAIMADSPIAATANTATIYFKPTQNWNGTSTFSYVAVDSNNLPSASENVSIMVNAVADAPILTVPSTTISFDEDYSQPLNIISNLTDTDGSETLEITITGVPNSATLSAGVKNSDGTWRLTTSQLSGLALIPAANFNGDINLVVTATASESSNSNTAAITQNMALHVNPINDLPTGTVSLDNIGNFQNPYDNEHRNLTNAREGDTLQAGYNLSDVDGMANTTSANVLYQWVRQNGSTTVIQNSTNNHYTLTPADIGYNISVSVNYTDDAGTLEHVASQSVTGSVSALPVNTVPTITGTNNTATLNETDSTLIASGSLTISDSDIGDTVSAYITQVTATSNNAGILALLDNDTLLNMLSLSSAGNALSGANILSGYTRTAPLTWHFNSVVDDTVTPPVVEAFNELRPGESLTLTYAIEVGDDKGGTATKDIVITINGTNETPVITVPFIDQGLAYTAVNWSYNLDLANHFEDSDGDPLNFTVTQTNGAALPSWMSFNPATGFITANPIASNLGDNYSLRVRATDTLGASVFDDFNISVSAFDYGNLFVSTTASETFSGTSGIDTVSYAQANAGVLVSLATSIATGHGTDTLNNIDNLVGSNFSDSLTGNSSANVLDGGDGNDTLDGGAGIDTLIGGLGNDVYIIGESTDVVIEKVNAGTDTVWAGANYTLPSYVENAVLIGTSDLSVTGNSDTNVLFGNNGNNTLDGGTNGDSMEGGAGNDTYVVDNSADVVVENVDSGNDTIQSSITRVLDTNVENLVLTGSSSINGTGNELANTITGNSGANVLNGASGIDTLVGLAGNDTYVVDNVLDRVIENAADGIDLVESSVSWTLGANVENLRLNGADSINGTGNELSNVLTGNSLSNRLDGGLGADSLTGGAGNDTYVVDNVGDIVKETSTGGYDGVESSVNYTLPTYVELLMLTGSATDATGNNTANALIGNTGDNLLDGRGGRDTMQGGVGNDTYVVDNVYDVIQEDSASGVDSVVSSTSYSLPNNVENLTLSGRSAINAVGNSDGNIISGNAGNNTLRGLAGSDSLSGSAGKDVLIGGAGIDTLSGGTGADTFK
ncbi:MAG: VCBS domain-containing protein, partial [Methylococcales bacterium]|nr:VCBS domain-containing protein [Methylococcales bacterium]